MSQKGEGPLVGDFDPTKVDTESGPVGPAARGDTSVTPDDIATAEWDPEAEEFGQKEAALDNEGAPKPSQGPPMQDQMEDPDFSAPDRHVDRDDTDLEPHEAPDTQDRIRSRIDQLKETPQGEGQIKEDGKELVQEEYDKQQAAHEAFKSHPTDTSVERSTAGEISDGQSAKGGKRRMETSSYHTPKHANGPLAPLAHPEANPIRLMVTMDEAFGEEWYDWEYETILETTHEEGVDIARQNQDKLMALKILHNTNRFWEEALVFEKVVIAFSGRIADWSVYQEPAPHDIAATRALVEHYIDERDFSDQVKAYTAGVALHAGFIMLPPRLRFARQPFSDQLLEKMGEEALKRQSELTEALQNNDPELVDEAGRVQFFRMVRCNFHAQEALDNI